jgi:deoxyguanosine kinase
VLRAPEGNPFLERFYRDGRRYALPTQLFFLFQRVNQLRELSQRDLFSQAVVGDFLLDKDPLFARLTLMTTNSCCTSRSSTTASAGPGARPGHLPAGPADTLIDRVRRRGIPMESNISEPYLRGLVETYSRFFYHYDAAPRDDRQYRAAQLRRKRA